MFEAEAYYVQTEEIDNKHLDSAKIEISKTIEDNLENIEANLRKFKISVFGKGDKTTNKYYNEILKELQDINNKLGE